MTVAELIEKLKKMPQDLPLTMTMMDDEDPEKKRVVSIDVFKSGLFPTGINRWEEDKDNVELEVFLS